MVALSIIMTIVASLIFPGVIVVVKAKLCGRKGPGFLQPLYDVVRLLKKGSVYSNTTSLIFQVAPVIYFASIIVASLLVPFGHASGILSFDGDFVFFACILATGKFLMIISALDTGSGFEGMGANREALYSMLLEPTFFIVMGSVSMLTQNSSFQSIYAHAVLDSYLTQMVVIVSVYLLMQIAMVENSRLPVDDPTTHLELTMVHEVMVLDNSGFDLALIQIGTWLKFALYGALISNFLIPPQWSLVGQVFVFLSTQIVFAAGIGLFESFRPRNKMARNPQWILTLSAVSLIVFLGALIIAHKFIIT